MKNNLRNVIGFRALRCFLDIQSRTKKKRKLEFYLLLGIMVGVGLLESVVTIWIAFYASLLPNPSLALKNVVVVQMLDMLHLSGTINAKVLLVGGSIIMAVLILLKNVAKGIVQYLSAKYSAKVEAEFGKQIADALMNNTYEWFLGKDPSKLQVIGQWRQNLGSFVLELLRSFSDFIIIVALFITLILYKPIVTAPVVFILGILGWVIFLINKRKLDQINETVITKNTNAFREYRTLVEGYKDIKINRVDKFFSKRFLDNLYSNIPFAAKRSLLVSLPALALETIGFFTLSAAVLFSVVAIGDNEHDVLALMAILGVTAWRVLPAIIRFLTGQTNIRGHIPMIDSVIEHVSEYETSLLGKPQEGIPGTDDTKINLQIKNLHYRYPGADQDSIRGISLNIPHGTKVGIIGESGSGKTTFVDLLTGLLTPTTGMITYTDAESGIEVAPNNLRIAYLPQRVYLVSGSLLENVVFGTMATDVTHQDIKDACRMAAIPDLWERFENPESNIGDRGSNLSGGQSQRVGIARLFYRDADIWVIDEGTGVLDSDTERVVLDSLFEIVRDKTVFMITHRVETVVRCNKALWIDSGEVKTFDDSEKVLDMIKNPDDFFSEGEKKPRKIE